MESRWLKSVFEETPHPKRVKFSDISAELHQHFPERKYSVYEVSKLVRKAFPHTESKRCGKSRQTEILQLARIESPDLEQSVSASQPGTSNTESGILTRYSDLLIENQLLKARIQELERFSATSLCSQADTLIHHASVVKHGPSSITAFRELDLASIVAELQFQAPDLYHLYMMVGDTKRNQDDGEVTTEEIKAVASMCSLLNARSANMKGLQLLMSMMLVARATSRQVWINSPTNNFI